MPEICKPIIVVSRCLGFEACRYDGQMLHESLVQRLKPFVQIMTVCPEADIGLGTPRHPVRLVRHQGEVHMIQPSTGADLTADMRDYLVGQVSSWSEIDGFLLKGRSPSCGPGGVKIYHGIDKVTGTEKGADMFAAAVSQAFPHAAIEDEGRLRNFHIRETFLMRIFALARLRQLMQQPSVAAISQFHASHKLLLMCFHQDMMRQCGRIAGNSDGLDLAQLMRQYAARFRETLQRQPSQRNIINALYHGYGWASDGLTSAEKKMFVDAVEEYRDERVTLATLQLLLKSYVLRFEHAYLGSQYFLEPYPKALFDLTSSGH